MIIAITGATGNFGNGFIEALNSAPDAANSIRVLCRSEKKAKNLLKSCPAIRDKITVVIGDITDANAVKQLIAGSDIVFNICAVIPPAALENPTATVACNEVGVSTLVAAIEAEENQPALVHISTVAVYGNRSGELKYGRVGEPLVFTPFELYNTTKIRGELTVLRSKIKKFAVLRQTAMLHRNIFSDNLKSGLMFHTCFDAPLEWLSQKDSGVMLLHLVQKEADGALLDGFWNKVYNMGGGACTRSYGYESYEAGFKIIGGKLTDFFKPYYNATRNFHGMWFTDSDVLENILQFRSQSCDDFWAEMKRNHRMYSLGKIVPNGLIADLVIKPLLKRDSAPAYWANHGDDARMTAYFGGTEKYEELKRKTWNDCPLPVEIPSAAPMTLAQKTAAYGYDIDKPDEAITVDDLKSVAEAHGGKLVSGSFNGMYEDVEWESCDGERFVANPYTVMRAGHWYCPSYRENVWDNDRLAKRDKLLARVWYADHAESENYKYSFDQNYNARMERAE